MKGWILSVHNDQLSWAGLGFHPTPKSFVRRFAELVAEKFSQRPQFDRAVLVLDACAGDGRLGHAVARRLVKLGYKVHITFVESSEELGLSVRPGSSYETNVIIGNILNQTFDRKFDLVLSNPPYRALGQKPAKELGLTWSEVTLGGRNLYGICLVSFLEFCRFEGLVVVLAPHGWITNVFSSRLRGYVRNKVSNILIEAYADRNLFPGVNQDTSIQCFELRDREVEDGTTEVQISYDGKFSHNLTLASEENDPYMGYRTRIGPLVWNRERDRLRSRGRVPVIYGGNISNGKLDLTVGKYRARQFVCSSGCPPHFFTRAPFIAFKRSMKGVPGDWRLDYAVVMEYGFRCVAENHVIIVELPSIKKANALKAAAELCNRLEYEHRHFGHANLSIAAVKRALRILNRHEPLDSQRPNT